MGAKTIVSTTSAPVSGEIELDFTTGGHKGGGSGPRNRERVSTVPRDPNAIAAETGVWVAVAAVSMSFAALISAMIVRQGVAPDWLHFQLPRILYFNTLILMVSSVTLEVSRHWLSTGPGAIQQESRDVRSPARGLPWLYITMALGLLFVAGQFIAWRDLAAKGLFLASSPSSSFFYVLTALHGLHLLGGVMGLAYVLYRLVRSAGPNQRRLLGVASVYWHFMDGLWVFLLVVLAARI
jgi:cytochrome c oxidase subunit III